MIDLRGVLDCHPFRFDEPTPWTFGDNYKLIPWNRAHRTVQARDKTPVEALFCCFSDFASACRGVLHEGDQAKMRWTEEEWQRVRSYGNAFFLGQEAGGQYDEQRRAECRSRDRIEAHPGLQYQPSLTLCSSETARAGGWSTPASVGTFPTARECGTSQCCCGLPTPLLRLPQSAWLRGGRTFFP